MQKDNKDYDKYRQPYADAWAQALKDKPDWVNKNRELFGLSEAATAWL